MANQKGFTDSCRHLDKLFSKFLVLKLNEPRQTQEYHYKSLTNLIEINNDTFSCQNIKFRLNKLMQNINMYNQLYSNFVNELNSTHNLEPLEKEYKQFVWESLKSLANKFTDVDRDSLYFIMGNKHCDDLISDFKNKLKILSSVGTLDSCKSFRLEVLKAYKEIKSNKLSIDTEIYKEVNKKYVTLLKTLDKEITYYSDLCSNRDLISVQYDSDKYIGATGNVITIHQPSDLGKAVDLEIGYCVRRYAMQKYY